jgi:hypothetical protein
MGSWSSQITCSGTPEDVLRMLIEPRAIARWSPVPFELHAFDGERLAAGDRVRVCGSLGGRSVEFLVDVGAASDGCVALTATGPIRIDVEYIASPAGAQSEVRASVGVQGHGLVGRVLAKATEALLAGGALQLALARLAGELELAVS